MNQIKWIAKQLIRIGKFNIFLSLVLFIIISIFDLTIILLIQSAISGQNFFRFDYQVSLAMIALIVLGRTFFNFFNSKLISKHLNYLYLDITSRFIENLFSTNNLNVLSFDAKTNKNILNFQISQIVQLLINPLLKILPDLIFLFVFILYLFYLIPVFLLVIFSLIFLIYLYIIKLINVRIKNNSKISFVAQSNLHYFVENLLNGLKEFILLYDGKEIFKKIYYSSYSYITKVTDTFYLSNLKRILLEFIMFLNILLCLFFIENKSDMLIIFGGFLRILPLVNNLNLFVTNNNNLTPVVNELRRAIR